MEGDAKQFSPRQVLAIPILAVEPTVEGGAAKAGVSKKTAFKWLKDPDFKEKVDRQRREFAQGALDQLKVNAPKAVDTLVALLKADRDSIKLRASMGILDFTVKALDFERIEKRVNDLERRLAEYEGR